MGAATTAAALKAAAAAAVAMPVRLQRWRRRRRRQQPQQWNTRAAAAMLPQMKQGSSTSASNRKAPRNMRKRRSRWSGVRASELSPARAQGRMHSSGACSMKRAACGCSLLSPPVMAQQAQAQAQEPAQPCTACSATFCVRAVRALCHCSSAQRRPTCCCSREPCMPQRLPPEASAEAKAWSSAQSHCQRADNGRPQLLQAGSSRLRIANGSNRTHKAESELLLNVTRLIQAHFARSLSEYEQHRVDHVGFATAVRPNHG